MDTPMQHGAQPARVKRTPVAAAPEVTRALARHAATLQYEALPPALVELTKQCVLDTLGVSIGASTLAPEAAILAEYVRDLGGKPEARCSASAARRPAPCGGASERQPRPHARLRRPRRERPSRAS